MVILMMIPSKQQVARFEIWQSPKPALVMGLYPYRTLARVGPKSNRPRLGDITWVVPFEHNPSQL